MYSYFPPMITSDTIVALATAPGVGAIGVIRLSGAQAIEIVDRFLKEKTLHNKNRIPFITDIFWTETKY